MRCLLLVVAYVTAGIMPAAGQFDPPRIAANLRPMDTGGLPAEELEDRL